LWQTTRRDIRAGNWIEAVFIVILMLAGYPASERLHRVLEAKVSEFRWKHLTDRFFLKLSANTRFPSVPLLVIFPSGNRGRLEIE
jgi:hypothetical protein